MRLPRLGGSSDADYAYAYGRASGMVGRLLTARELENYAAAVSVDEIVASLENTPYGVDITKTVWTPKNIPEIERALNENYARVYSEVLALIPKEDARELDSLLMGLWHHRNLKLILRGIHAGVAKEEIRGDIKSQTGVDYGPMLEAAGVMEFALLLDETYKNRLSAAGVFEKNKPDLGFIESLMDAALVDSWQTTLKKRELADYAGVVADTTNLLALVRCIKAGVNPAGYLSKAGKEFTRDRLVELSSMNLEGVSEALKKTPYARAFSDGLKAIEESGSLLTIEKELEACVSKYVDEKAIQKPLSIYAVLAFIAKKLNEVENIRKIIILKSHKIPAEKIRGVLRFA